MTFFLTTSFQHDEMTLLKLAAMGNGHAFIQMMNHWQPFLSTHIYRIPESKWPPEEIVQDVFFKSWQTRETLSSIHHFKGYLPAISKDHALNALKKTAKEFSNTRAFQILAPAF